MQPPLPKPVTAAPPFWDLLDIEARASIEHVGRTRLYSRGESVCRRAGCDDVHVITGGYLRSMHILPSGGTGNLHDLYRPGDIVNATVAEQLGEHPHANTHLEAATTVTVHTIGRREFADLVRAQPLLSRMCELAAQDTRRCGSISGRAPAQRRLVLALLDAVLAATASDAHPATTAVIATSQWRLAEAAGATRETLRHLLRDLQAAQLITASRNKIVVHDIAALHYYSTASRTPRVPRHRAPTHPASTGKEETST